MRMSKPLRIVLPRFGQVKSFAMSRSRMPKAIIIVLVLIFAIAGMSKCAYNRRLAIATANSKANAHMIQLAVERYATDFEGTYPLSLNQIIGTGYLPEMPRNYFAGVLKRWPTLESPRPMRPLMLGEYCPGDVLYLPQYDDPKEIYGYTIIVAMGNRHAELAGAPLGFDTTQPVNDWARLDTIAQAYQRGPQP